MQGLSLEDTASSSTGAGGDCASKIGHTLTQAGSALSGDQEADKRPCFAGSAFGPTGVPLPSENLEICLTRL